MTAVTKKNFEWDFHLPPKADTCVKFQLSRLIFIFISCQQLLSAVNSWSAIQNDFLELDSHIGPRTGFRAEFNIDWLIGSRTRE